MIKIILKRLLATVIAFFGTLFLVGGVYVNLFVKLPTSMENADFASGLGIIVGTILGTGTLIVICVLMIMGAVALWKK